MNEQQQEAIREEGRRVARQILVLSKLAKWVRAFKDDIIAEEGAVKQYTSQMDEFNRDLDDIRNLNIPEINTLVDMINADDKSVFHILEEEKEHIEEFTNMVSTLESILKKSRKL
jgi:rubrerythrin